MENLDVDKLLGAMENDTVGSNAMSIMDMLDMANKVTGQVTSLMDKFDKMGLKPLLVRGLGQKLSIDAESPLISDNAIIPRTPTHQNLFAHLNSMSEDQITELFSDAQPQDTPDNKLATVND